MSNQIMTLCWDLEMPATQKFVLVALADMANDAGVCWPSVALLVRRTGLGERTIQDAFRWLAVTMAVTIKRETGKANTFTINPAAFTPAAAAPRSSRTPQQPHPTPATTAPPPPQQPHPTPAVAAPRTQREPKVEPKGNPKSEPADSLSAQDLVELGVDPQHAKDWLRVRKDKGAKTLTRTAWAGLCREASKAGLTPPEAVQIAAERGWQSFKADWWKGRARDSPSSTDQTTAEAARLLGFNRQDFVDA